MLTTTDDHTTDDHSTDDHSTEGGHCGAEWSGTEGLVVIVCALLSGVISKMLLSGTRMPYTVLLTIFGCIMGVVHYQLKRKGAGINGENYEELSLYLSNDAWTEINPHVLLFVFLPILIFESALNCEWHIFKRQLKSILALAIPGVVISTVLTAAIIMLLHTEKDHWDWTAALTCGAILAATDPVAVVALMKELGVSERLGTLMEGESLLNDGTAIVVFGVFYAQLSENYKVCHAHSLDPGESIALFFRLGLGGVALGGTVGWFLQKSLSRVFNDPPTEVTLTVLAAFGVMLLAEGTIIEVSGVLSVVTLGLTMAAKGKYFISTCSQEVVENFWSMLGYLANTVIFFVSGLIVAARAANDPDILAYSLWRGVVLWVLLHFVRGIMIILLWPVLSSGQYSFSVNQAVAVVYGGLRGAVGLTLALIVHEQLDEQKVILDERGETNKSKAADILGDEILFYVSIVAFLTLMVNGTTMEFVLTRLGLSDPEEASARSLEQATAVLSRETVNTLRDLKLHNDHDTDWAGALAYVPCRSQRSYKILRAALDEELNSAQVGPEMMRKSLSMRPSVRDVSVTENVCIKLQNKLCLSIDAFKEYFNIEEDELKEEINPLMLRIPGRLKERWMRYEKKWDNFAEEVEGHDGFAHHLSDELLGDVEMQSTEEADFALKSNTFAEVTTEMQDMYELRRRFAIALKSSYSKLQAHGICEAVSTASLVDGANRQCDDTEESKEHPGEHARGNSLAFKKAVEEGSVGIMDESMGRPLLSWFHLKDAVELDMPLLSSAGFSCLLNTPGTRLFVKEVVAGRLGTVFEIVDGFIVGHTSALKQFIKDNRTEVDDRASRLENRLRDEVSNQVQLAKNSLDKMLSRFPEIARSIKTKKAARQLLAADREVIEKLRHDGRIEEGEEEELLEKNNISQKKLHDHPAGLTVPNKPDRIAQHELFCRRLTKEAAKALAGISKEYYFDPNKTLAEQGAPATKWFLPIHGEFSAIRRTDYFTPDKVSHCGNIKLEENEQDVTPHWHVEDGMFLYSGDDQEHAHRLRDITRPLRRPLGLYNAPLCLGDALSYAISTEQLANAETSSSVPTPKAQAPSKRGSVLGAKTVKSSVTYSASLRSPGHTQVLMIDAAQTWSLMKEHKTLREALWRYVSASLVATNYSWIGQVIPEAPHHVQHSNIEPLPNHSMIGRALALCILPEQLRIHKPPIGKVRPLGTAAYTGDGSAQDDVDLLAVFAHDVAAVLLLHGTMTVAYDNSAPRVISAPNPNIPATDLDHHCLIALGEMDEETEMVTSKPTLLKASPGSVVLSLSGKEIGDVHAFAKKVAKNASLQNIFAPPPLLHEARSIVDDDDRGAEI
jgi:NhaP-type Na+/H+ or K+/H+ antiporter